MEFNLALHFVRLLVGGIVCFLAILIMSKTRDSEWMFLISGFLCQFFFEVLSILTQLGLIPIGYLNIISFLYFLVPSLLFSIAFIIKLIKKRG